MCYCHDSRSGPRLGRKLIALPNPVKYWTRLTAKPENAIKGSNGQDLGKKISPTRLTAIKFLPLTLPFPLPNDAQPEGGGKSCLWWLLTRNISTCKGDSAAVAVSGEVKQSANMDDERRNQIRCSEVDEVHYYPSDHGMPNSSWHVGYTCIYNPLFGGTVV